MKCKAQPFTVGTSAIRLRQTLLADPTDTHISTCPTVGRGGSSAQQEFSFWTLKCGVSLAVTVGFSYVKNKTHAADSTGCPESNHGTDQVETPRSVFFMPPVFGEFS